MSRRALPLTGAALIVLLLCCGYLALRRSSHAFSARAQPTRAEALLAAAARSAATPEWVRRRRNPVTLTPAALQEGMAHYADHCAVCHGNNGAGDTVLGQGMYPKPPDMRLSGTQNRSDGELFNVIENGVRLSGMPAFGGDTGTEEQSWKLVHFLRHLPALTAAEEHGMQAMNPKSPDELKEEQEEDRFLHGDGTPEGVASRQTSQMSAR